MLGKFDTHQDWVEPECLDTSIHERFAEASPLPGPSGNVEYFLWLRRGAPPLDHEQLRRAIEEGPH